MRTLSMGARAFIPVALAGAVILGLAPSTPAAAAESRTETQQIAASGHRQITGRVNLRRGAGIDNARITVLRDDTRLVVLAKAKDHYGRTWLKVDTGNRTGWVASWLTAKQVASKDDVPRGLNARFASLNRSAAGFRASRSTVARTLAPTRARTVARTVAPTLAARTYSAGNFAWPTTSHRISQFFHTGHYGLDIDGNTGDPIFAAAGGTVTFAGWKSNGGGYQVWIAHGSGRYTTYNHMSSVSVGRGQHVGRGQRVGRMGASGLATGSHLHFEVWRGAIWNGGTRVNPLGYL